MPFYAYPRPIQADDLLDQQKHQRKSLNKALYVAMYISLIIYGVLSLLEPFLMTYSDCERVYPKAQQNVDYPLTPCHYDSHLWLMGMSRFDCMLARRMIFSSVLGAIIGWERRAVDRPAGMRTMSLVCMGACLFTITSIFGFLDSPMNWDSSRVSAAIPSGVGFLGAGLIWKTTTGEGHDAVHQIHGLTTAASVWLSASIGVAVGGGYFFISTFSVILIVKVLKYGPRIFYQKDDLARYESSSESECEDNEESEIAEDVECGRTAEFGSLFNQLPSSKDFNSKNTKREQMPYQYSTFSSSQGSKNVETVSSYPPSKMPFVGQSKQASNPEKQPNRPTSRRGPFAGVFYS